MRRTVDLITCDGCKRTREEAMRAFDSSDEQPVVDQGEWAHLWLGSNVRAQVGDRQVDVCSVGCAQKVFHDWINELMVPERHDLVAREILREVADNLEDPELGQEDPEPDDH